MNQGISVDYGIVSPGPHVDLLEGRARSSTRPSCSATSTHWNKVLDADLLKPIADEIAQKADVMLIGYAGGGVRNIFVNKPVRNLAEMKGLKVRVQGAPIWSRTFSAIGMSPTVIAYNEIYNAIQNGVIAAGENEAAGVEQMKFFEVGPEPLDDRARDHDPADLLLRQDLQEAAARPAGRGHQGRQGSRRLRPPDRVLGGQRQARRAGEGRQAQAHRRSPIAREMKKLVDPVMAAYAKEIGADAIYAQINAIKSARPFHDAVPPRTAPFISGDLRAHEKAASTAITDS